MINAFAWLFEYTQESAEHVYTSSITIKTQFVFTDMRCINIHT